LIKTLNLIIHLSKNIFVFAGASSVLPETNLNSTKHLPYRADVFGTFWNVLKHPNTAKFFGQDSETTFCRLSHSYHRLVTDDLLFTGSTAS